MCLDSKIYLIILNGFYNNDLKLLKIFCPFITTCNPERVSNSTVWVEVLSPSLPVTPAYWELSRNPTDQYSSEK